MKSLWHAAAMVAVALAFSGQGRAQNDNHLGGLIHHYADAPANDPWHLSGQWSARLQGESGNADFTAAISMVKSDNASRQPHAKEQRRQQRPEKMPQLSSRTPR